jgi:hypothetical protein
MSFVASSYMPPSAPSPFSRPLPAWHPAPAFTARGARETRAVPGASASHAAAAAAAARSAHAARVSAAKMQRRARAAAAKCGQPLGDFFNLNMFPMPNSVSGSPAAAPAPASQGTMTVATPLGPMQKKKAAPQGQSSGGGETYWQNVYNELFHPVQTARQVSDLWSSSTPGNVFDKIESLAANTITGQVTPAQYQLIKYQMAVNLRKAGATPAQVALEEAQLDQYVRVNTPGLAGGEDPGNVPDTPPKSTIPWWVWAAAGGGFLFFVLAVRR